MDSVMYKFVVPGSKSFLNQDINEIQEITMQKTQVQNFHQQQQSEQKTVIQPVESKKGSGRATYTSKQVIELEKAFNQYNYLTRTLRYYLSDNLGLTERQVKIWYQNRRMKKKRDENKKDSKRKIKMEVGESQTNLTSVSSPETRANGYDIQTSMPLYQQQPMQQQILQLNNQPIDQEESHGLTESISATSTSNNNFDSIHSAVAKGDSNLFQTINNNNKKIKLFYQQETHFPESKNCNCVMCEILDVEEFLGITKKLD